MPTTNRITVTNNIEDETKPKFFRKGTIFRQTFLCLLLTCIGSMAQGNALNGSEQMKLDFEQSAQTKIKAFASELKANLSSAIQSGGFEKGVSVCKDIAPSIASKYSTNGWKISRTSLKTRNKNNIPDQWEMSVLNEFEFQNLQGTDITSLVRFAKQIKDQEMTLRYMKAIPVDGLCLSCHGENLSDEVQGILNSLYPHDHAKGYKLGDIRGAFSIQQSIPIASSGDKP